jgi:hypothetical protein
MVTAQKFSALEINYRAFVRLLPELLPDHEGQYALMRDGRVVRYFASPRGALLAGRARFTDDLFSVQEVRRSQADFGWFSHVYQAVAEQIP